MVSLKLKTSNSIPDYKASQRKRNNNSNNNQKNKTNKNK